MVTFPTILYLEDKCTRIPIICSNKNVTPIQRWQKYKVISKNFGVLFFCKILGKESPLKSVGPIYIFDIYISIDTTNNASVLISLIY